MNASSINLAVIPGDGIGPEVIAEAVKVLEKALAAEGVTLEQTHYKLGAQHWLETGETLPDEVLDDLRTRDAILFGAVGAAPGTPAFPQASSNAKCCSSCASAWTTMSTCGPRVSGSVGSPLANPGEIDFIVVREGTEGPYVGNGGTLRGGTAHEVATEVSLNTAHGVERVVRDAFRRASARPRKHVTLVHKHNVLVYAGHLWKRTVEAVAKEFPEVTHDYLHIDAATIFMVTDPSRFDVIVTDNLFGDILTDLAAAVTGGIGLAASGNINMDRTAPSMFEPVHGSAPDIAGQQKADPTAAILSAVLLLEHLGYTGAARKIEAAVIADVEARTGGPRSTAAIGDAIAAAL